MIYQIHQEIALYWYEHLAASSFDVEVEDEQGDSAGKEY
jgi:hypothetical protein